MLKFNLSYANILLFSLCFVRSSFASEQQLYGAFSDEQEKDIQRPCPVFDVNCIREYLSSRSGCKPAYGPIPDPFYRPQATYYYPQFNISAVQNDVYYTGMRGSVSGFYVNPVTDVTVLTVRVDNVTIASTRDVFSFQRAGKEPALTQSFTRAYFPTFLTTSVFAGTHQLKLSNSETYVTQNGVAAVFYAPSAAVHPDPVVARAFAALLSDPETALFEAELVDGAFYAGTFIQNVLCDFGLRII